MERWTVEGIGANLGLNKNVMFPRNFSMFAIFRAVNRPEKWGGAEKCLQLQSKLQPEKFENFQFLIEFGGLFQKFGKKLSLGCPLSGRKTLCLFN